jgi:hypothetical protein
VKQLESRVDQLEANDADVSLTVNCAEGATISNALLNNTRGNGRLTITVTGTCNEAVTVRRSNVTIRGLDSSATLQSPSTILYGLTVTENAHDVSIESLRMLGGVAPLLAINGAHAVVRNVTAQQGTYGIQAFDNGNFEVTGSTISNNTYGVSASRGGIIVVTNSTIENNTSTGMLAFRAGTVQLTSVEPNQPAGGGNGVVVRNNGIGGLARASGYIELSDATIQNNRSYGLLADSVSTIDLFVAQNGTGNRITGNAAGGILLQRSAGLVVSDNSSVITGNTLGILCQNGPGYIVPAGFTVTGNTNGDVIGCSP